MIVYQTQTITIPDGFNLIGKDRDDNDIYLSTNEKEELRISDEGQMNQLSDVITELKKLNIQISDITGNQITEKMTL